MLIRLVFSVSLSACMGAMDFVAKPFVPDILLSRVAKTIELDQYRHNLEKMVKEQADKLTENTRRILRKRQIGLVIIHDQNNIFHTNNHAFLSTCDVCDCKAQIRD